MIKYIVPTISKQETGEFLPISALITVDRFVPNVTSLAVERRSNRNFYKEEIICCHRSTES